MHGLLFHISNRTNFMTKWCFLFPCSLRAFTKIDLGWFFLFPSLIPFYKRKKELPPFDLFSPSFSCFRFDLVVSLNLVLPVAFAENRGFLSAAASFSPHLAFVLILQEVPVTRTMKMQAIQCSALEFRFHLFKLPRRSLCSSQSVSSASCP